MECFGNVGWEAQLAPLWFLPWTNSREPGEFSDVSGFMFFPQLYPQSCLCVLERERCVIFCRVRLVFTMSLESSQTQGENIWIRSHWLILAGKQDLESSGGGEGRKVRERRVSKRKQLFWLHFFFAWLNLVTFELCGTKRTQLWMCGAWEQRVKAGPGAGLAAGRLALGTCSVAGTSWCGTWLPGRWGRAEGRAFRSCSWCRNYGASPELSIRWDLQLLLRCFAAWEMWGMVAEGQKLLSLV